MDGANTSAQSEQSVSLLTILLAFLKVGAFTFGGGYAMLPVIQREVITHHRWVDPPAFMDILLVTQSLPGPLALNSAIIIGKRLRGFIGGLVAALGVVLPSFAIILIIVAFILPYVRDNVYVTAAFYGLRPAVAALVAAAALKLGADVLRDRRSLGLMLILLVAALLLSPHPILVLAAGAAGGFLLYRKMET